MDLYQGKVPMYYPLSELVVSPLDVFHPRMIGGILRKVDGTFVFALESKFFLPNPQLSDELLHPNNFLIDFDGNHVLGFCGREHHCGRIVQKWKDKEYFG